MSRALTHESGMTVVEILAVVVLSASFMLAAIPQFGEARRAAELRAVTQQLHGLMLRSRAWAICHCTSTGLVFERSNDGRWRCFIAEDRDGDGILRADLRSGTDRIVSEVLQLESTGAGLGLLKNIRIPDPSGDGRLRGNLDDPVRAGRGDIVTFTPDGNATPSSVYLTDHRARMRVLRIYGATGRVRTLIWRQGWPEWRQSGM